jgi:iron complex outermembrane receptor protein
MNPPVAGRVAPGISLIPLTVLALGPAGSSAARAADAAPLADVVVTATRVAVPAFDVPATIIRVPGTRFVDDSLGVNFADGARSVPGLLARNQYNYAQDQQISIRGIGADSAFGVRGVRIYQDGIPQSGPDGQGQISQFNLGSASRVEVLEGPFSALYGNSSGGVIQLFTAPGVSPGSVRADLAGGSFGAVRAGVDASDAIGPLDYHLDFTHFSWRGFRPHQRARSESFNGKVDYAFGPRETLTVIANVLSRPDANDPQGLTAAQFAADPYQTSVAALAFDTRKDLGQQEGGLIYRRGLTAHQSLRLMGYYGHRTVLQFLSIPVGAQKPVTSAGGVVDLHRDFGGADARWTWQGPLAGRPLAWVAGLSYDTQNERRRGYDNFVGPTLGVQGALRRDENDIARNLDEYTQASLTPAPRWTVTAGLRHSDVRFTTEDHFFAGGNGSGAITYAATTPVIGVLYAARRGLHLYASWGQGFRTPLASELAYRPDGLPGLNLGLRPARSNGGELGAKIRVGRSVSAELSAFDTRTNDEIVVVTNSGGRSTYENAGRTRRSGAQASLHYRFSPAWRLRFAYTYVDAVVIDAYDTCTASPCSQPTVRVAAGNRLPGVARNDAYAQLRWGRAQGWHASVSGQYLGAIAADSTNREFASAYPVFNLSGGYRTRIGEQRLALFLRLDNLLDRRYVGAVIVNQANGAYFEPAPGFNVLAGVTVRLR